MITHKPWYKRLDFWLIGILLLALWLNAWAIWDAGSSDAFYTAAIKSGTLSWKAFFFGSLDPANYITVDKPPVALWFPELLGRIFGVHGWTVTLPSALFGVGASYLMYAMIRPRFGKWAGRISALVMTITPIAVADNRVDNMDATLVFFCLLAIFFLLKAVKKQQLRYVFISFALIGVAYNVKMLEAFMILPGMFVFYFIAIKLPWKKLLLGFLASLAILGATSFSYSVIVDSIPASQRPYVGSTQDDSEISLSFGYNGTERLLGQTTGTGGAFPGMNSSSKTSGAPAGAGPSGTTSNKTAMVAPGGFGSANMTPAGGFAGSSSKSSSRGPGGAGGAGGAFAIGTAGPLRLIQSDLGPMASWFLPSAIIGMFVGFFATRKKKSKWYALSEKQKEVVLWAGWLVPVGVFFSIASFFHPYYLDMLAPAIAALTAIGVVELARHIKKSERKFSWANVVFALLMLVTYAVQATYTWSYYKTWTIILGVVAVVIALWWFWPSKKFIKTRAAASIMILSIFTGWWAMTPTLSHQSAEIPTVGPSLLSSSGSQRAGIGSMGGNADSKVLAYTEKNQGSATYLFATTDASTAAPYIIASGKSVMALGGFNGTDPSISLSKFKQLVKEGKVKYFYSGGKGAMAGNSTGATGEISKIVEWIKANAKTVSSVSSSASGSSSNSTSTSSSTISSNGLPAGIVFPSESSSAIPQSGAAGMTPPSGISGTIAPSGSSTISNSIAASAGASTSSSGQPGGQSSGSLYDLTTITNFN